MKYYAVIEAGGTKFNCAVMDAEKNIIESNRIATTTPQQTLGEVCEFFHAAGQQYQLTSLGLASFGPMDLMPASANYGGISKTPKPDWSHTPLSQYLADELKLPVYFDTDVNGAILSEYLWGNAQQTEVAVYTTIGTGFGGGIIVNGKILHGLHHPEMGHMLIPNNSSHTGHCPFHHDCLEGLASGTAMNKTWQKGAEQLPNNHKAWQQEAIFIASYCHNLIVTLAPNVIILGGGVMQNPEILDKIIAQTKITLADYLTLPVELEDIIKAPGLGDKAGVFGAFALAQGKGSHHVLPKN